MPTAQDGVAQAVAMGHAGSSGVQTPHAQVGTSGTHPLLQNLEQLSTLIVTKSFVSSGKLSIPKGDEEVVITRFIKHLRVVCAHRKALMRVTESVKNKKACTKHLSDDLNWRIVEVRSQGPGQQDSVRVVQEAKKGVFRVFVSNLLYIGYFIGGLSNTGMDIGDPVDLRLGPKAKQVTLVWRPSGANDAAVPASSSEAAVPASSSEAAVPASSSEAASRYPIRSVKAAAGGAQAVATRHAGSSGVQAPGQVAVPQVPNRDPRLKISGDAAATQTVSAAQTAPAAGGGASAATRPTAPATDGDEVCMEAVYGCFVCQCVPNFLLPAGMMQAGGSGWHPATQQTGLPASDDACLDQAENQEMKVEDMQQDTSLSRKRDAVMLPTSQPEAKAVKQEEGTPLISPGGSRTPLPPLELKKQPTEAGTTAPFVADDDVIDFTADDD
jgi:hypothetical protein